MKGSFEFSPDALKVRYASEMRVRKASIVIEVVIVLSVLVHIDKSFPFEVGTQHLFRVLGFMFILYTVGHRLDTLKYPFDSFCNTVLKKELASTRIKAENAKMREEIKSLFIS